ncbi:hypothetical protein Dimus_028852, partial [Dionaea muscipula]
ARPSLFNVVVLRLAKLLDGMGLQLALSTAAAEMHAAVAACGLQAWVLHAGLRCGQLHSRKSSSLDLTLAVGFTSSMVSQPLMIGCT